MAHKRVGCRPRLKLLTSYSFNGFNTLLPGERRIGKTLIERNPEQIYRRHHNFHPSDIYKPHSKKVPNGAPFPPRRIMRYWIFRPLNKHASDTWQQRGNLLWNQIHGNFRRVSIYSRNISYTSAYHVYMFLMTFYEPPLPVFYVCSQRHSLPGFRIPFGSNIFLIFLCMAIVSAAFA